MSLQVSLKLKLTRVNKKITAKYNTFEKATYDEYLSASIALRSKNEEEAIKYINDITGQGSLNGHLKKLYYHSNTLNKEQLQSILENSLYPILKIDDSNRYVYFPNLNVSVFKGKIYLNDIEYLNNLTDILYIQEKIIDISVNQINSIDKSEPYTTLFDNDNIIVKIENEWIDINKELFSALLDYEIDNINRYPGTIHNSVDGNGWSILTNSSINNIISNKNCFYENGNNFQIRNDDVRKTTVSSINGLFIYKEETLPYKNNKRLCEKVISVLLENNSINEFKTKALINILNYVEDTTAQKVINYILGRKESKELTLLGIDLLERGLEKKWSDSSLLSFIKHSDRSHLNIIYKANPNLDFSIEKLIFINRDYLNDAHLNRVKDYFNDLAEMKSTINRIIGKITTSGLRESVKKLKANSDTKRFSKLSNELIGHVKKDLDKSDYKEIKKWHEEALEFEALAEKISKELLVLVK